MNKFFIPALELLEARVRKGFSKRQKILAVLLGLVILVNFMFRAGCPPERRFFKSGTSRTIAICAPADVVKNAVPLGGARSVSHLDAKPALSL